MRRYPTIFIMALLLTVLSAGRDTQELSRPLLAAPLHYPAPIPFELVSGKPYLRVRVNGSKPLWFILDTGSAGGPIIDRKRALELGLKIQGEKKTHAGAGEGATVTIGHTGNVTFDVSGYKLTSKSAAVVPLDHVAPYDGHQFDGTLGHDFFQHYVVELDYAKKVMYLHEPENFEYAGPGKKIPFKFLGGLVSVRASVKLPGRKPIEADFVVDTGARTALLFNSPFVRKHKMLESLPKSFAATIGGGVGGESKGRVGRIESLKLGPFALKEPVAAFSSDKSGVLAGGGFAGIIGARILRRCRVIFDYRRREMILEPAARKPGAYEYDMSGLFLIGEGLKYNKFKIMSVVKDSPAAEAGLQRGDIITAINGRKASEFTLEQVREMFLREGKEYKLEFRRGDNELKVKLKTRRLI